MRRETRRAVAGVARHEDQIWPGIEIDIPTGEKEKNTTPDDVYAAVKATFEAGAQRHHPVAQILGDAARQPARRGARDPRIAKARVTDNRKGRRAGHVFWRSRSLARPRARRQL